MMLLKSGQIINCCHPNSLITLKEFLMDYASEGTKILGEKVITKEIQKIQNEKVKATAMKNLVDIGEGKRDFRF